MIEQRGDQRLYRGDQRLYREVISDCTEVISDCTEVISDCTEVIIDCRGDRRVITSILVSAQYRTVHDWHVDCRATTFTGSPDNVTLYCYES